MRELILAKTKKPYKSLIKSELHEGATADDVLDYLFGDRDGWINSDYTIREYEEVKTNILQRIATPFVWLIFVIILCPVKWLLTGRYGFKTESMLYKVFKVLTGE